MLVQLWLACAPADPVHTDADTDLVEETPETDDPYGGGDPYADAVVSFTPGDGAGFGQDRFPDVVLGPPQGGGAPSVDVLSLGREGTIVLRFEDYTLVDGPGVDLTVFENAFTGWTEPAFVAVSDDAETWYEWPCDPVADGQPGCAGVAPASAGPEGADPTDPSVSGGDQYDLADLGVGAARYVRLRDAGTSSYDGDAGGFDLDAVAVIHGAIP
jgi:hypothetical protein